MGAGNTYRVWSLLLKEFPVGLAFLLVCIILTGRCSRPRKMLESTGEFYLFSYLLRYFFFSLRVTAWSYACPRRFEELRSPRGWLVSALWDIIPVRRFLQPNGWETSHGSDWEQEEMQKLYFFRPCQQSKLSKPCSLRRRCYLSSHAGAELGSSQLRYLPAEDFLHWVVLY